MLIFNFKASQFHLTMQFYYAIYWKLWAFKNSIFLSTLGVYANLIENNFQELNHLTNRIKILTWPSVEAIAPALFCFYSFFIFKNNLMQSDHKFLEKFIKLKLYNIFFILYVTFFLLFLFPWNFFPTSSSLGFYFYCSYFKTFFRIY